MNDKHKGKIVYMEEKNPGAFKIIVIMAIIALLGIAVYFGFQKLRSSKLSDTQINNISSSDSKSKPAISSEKHEQGSTFVNSEATAIAKVNNTIENLRELIDKDVDKQIDNKHFKVALGNYVKQLEDEFNNLKKASTDKPQKTESESDALSSGIKPDTSQSNNILTWVNTGLLSLLLGGILYLIFIEKRSKEKGHVMEKRLSNWEESNTLLLKSVDMLKQIISNQITTKDYLTTFGQSLRDFENEIKNMRQNLGKSSYPETPPFNNKWATTGIVSTSDEIIKLYNSQSEDDFKSRYESIKGLGVLNSTERRSNSKISPIFDEDNNPGLWGIQSEDNKMFVLPRMGIKLNSAHNINAYAIDKIFDLDGNPSDRYMVIRPAIFVRSENGWNVEKNGKIEFQ